MFSSGKTVTGLLVAAAAGMLALSTSAKAGTVDSNVELDVNSITIQARNAADTMNVGFNSSFSGLLVFGKDADSSLGMKIDSGKAVAGAIVGFTGRISLTNGNITGGTLSVMVSNPDSSVDTYSTNVVPGSGTINSPPNAALASLGFYLSGATAGGTFTDSNFGGLDVSVWNGQQPLAGSFLQFRYKPSTNGFDSDSDVNLYATAQIPDGAITAAAPLPASAWAGMALLGGLGAVRKMARRRRSA